MANTPLDMLKQILREGGDLFSLPPVEGRIAFDTMLEEMPRAEDILFGADTLAGIPTVTASTPASSPDRALLYLHGGAYTIGSPTGYRGLIGELARASGTTGFGLHYRLAPEHPLPAAVDDALAAYRTLLDRGYPASRIVIGGDSAGGGLTMALLQAIRNSGLPQPAAALTISPWVDLSFSGASIAAKQAEDPSLRSESLRVMAAHYLAGQDADNPLASPIRGDLSGLAPVLVQVGSAEILLDDAIALARALGMANTPVTLDIVAGAPHVWHLFHFMIAEGADAIARAGAFLSAAMDG